LADFKGLLSHLTIKTILLMAKAILSVFNKHDYSKITAVFYTEKILFNFKNSIVNFWQHCKNAASHHSFLA